MDTKRFDEVTKMLGSGATRRAVLRGLLGSGSVIAAGHLARTDTSARPVGTKPVIPFPPCPQGQSRCGNAACCDQTQHCCFDQNGTNKLCCAAPCAPSGVCCTPQTCASLVDDCNDAACDAITGACVLLPKSVGTACDTGQNCTRNDQCNGAGSCVGEPFACAGDTNPCSSQVCNKALGGCELVLENAGVPCVSGDPCFENEACDGAGVCAGSPVECDNSNLCRPASCSPGFGCIALAIFCFDDNPCTTDRCVPETGSCEFTPIEGCIPV